MGAKGAILVKIPDARTGFSNFLEHLFVGRDFVVGGADDREVVVRAIRRSGCRRGFSPDTGPDRA